MRHLASPPRRLLAAALAVAAALALLAGRTDHASLHPWVTTLCAVAAAALAAVLALVLLTGAGEPATRSPLDAVPATGERSRARAVPAGGHRAPRSRRRRPDPDGDPDLTATSDLEPEQVKRLTIDSSVAAPGLPVQVTWFFADADTVLVDGTEFPGQIGTAHVMLDRTQQIELTAENALGRVTAWTEVVVVLPLPRIGALDIPAPPPVRLHADVTTTLSAGLGAVAALDALFERQDRTRRHARRPAGHLLPSSLTSLVSRGRSELPGWDDAVAAASSGPRTPRLAHRPEGPPHA